MKKTVPSCSQTNPRAATLVPSNPRAATLLHPSRHPLLPQPPPRLPPPAAAPPPPPPCRSFRPPTPSSPATAAPPPPAAAPPRRLPAAPPAADSPSSPAGTPSSRPPPLLLLHRLLDGRARASPAPLLVGGCVVVYVFHVLLRSESGFRRRLPVVLRMHILSAFCRDVYRESSGEVLPKF
ncbi:hypothetical protein QYE76_029043 [Lolium multiflorum]|uniref:Uncharacterized protein n=1 Tax=Lolium multiflorum TaxID=4521 RepID=A0AAD8QM24_LOLMU|nr:hypothetical protein QYE76_029043 [Lolium multiflorum]